MSSEQDQLGQLAYLFRYFGERQCYEDSPFYANLAFQIANDRELLKLASVTPRGQWVQNMLFAAVHDLLLRGVQHPLRAYYPTTAAAPNPANAFPVFRAFCLDYADDIRELLTTRRGQTNEIGRCALLMPAFSAVYQHAGAPLALIDVGASAGLNLLFDRYSYYYSNGQRYGAQRSPVQLKCELRGPWRPALPEQLPPVTWRVGIDLAPVDIRDRNAVRWLRALVWPDDLRRMWHLEAAIALAARKPPTVWAGDAFDRLPEALAAAPQGAIVCIYHSFVLTQFSEEYRARFYNLLAELSFQRDLYCVSLELFGTSTSELALSLYHAGECESTLLATCQPHGRYMEWQS